MRTGNKPEREITIKDRKTHLRKAEVVIIVENLKITKKVLPTKHSAIVCTKGGRVRLSKVRRGMTRVRLFITVKISVS